MLSYYLTAAGTFTLGFLAAAALTSGRRAQAARERAWLMQEIATFVAKCRRSSSDADYLVDAADLKRLREAAQAADLSEKP